MSLDAMLGVDGGDRVSAVNECCFKRRNGLELMGQDASGGGSVGIDFSDCAFYPF